MDEIKIFLKPFSDGTAINATLSSVRDGEYERGKIKKIELSGETVYQIELFTKTQAFHRNIKTQNIAEELTTLLTNNFRQITFTDTKFNYSLKITKKEKVLTSKKLHNQNITAEAKSHNKEKKYLLKEGEIILPLIDLGIFTKEGKIVKSMYDKYRQINRFVEFVEDIVSEKNYKSLNIIDFGCGKSYLTFVLYHYLNHVKKIPTKITGLDLKEEVVNNCNKTAKKYGYDSLSFHIGDIANYSDSTPVDMVITLHACDTATDYALYHALKLDAKMIMSVPCCQHEINASIPSDVSTIFTEYGIIKERMSALATDAIRANLLELCGYKAQLLEFVDIAHSPKNILIRAVRENSKKNKAVLLAQIEEFISYYRVTPTLYKLVMEDKRRLAEKMHILSAKNHTDENE